VAERLLLLLEPHHLGGQYLLRGARVLLARDAALPLRCRCEADDGKCEPDRERPSREAESRPRREEAPRRRWPRPFVAGAHGALRVRRLRTSTAPTITIAMTTASPTARPIGGTPPSPLPGSAGAPLGAVAPWPPLPLL